MHAIVPSVLLLCLVAGNAAGAETDPRHTPKTAAVRTGKERLGSKASDEQRVDDCKVPPALRTRERPTECSGGDR